MAGIMQKLHLKQAQPGYQPGAYGYPKVPAEQKALKFEQKALQYEQKGNLAKAQKNRDKAARFRARAAPGYTTPEVPMDRHHKKLARLDQKALMYEQKGNMNKANRSRQRAARLRAKYGIPAGGMVGGAPLMAGVPLASQYPVGQGYTSQVGFGGVPVATAGMVGGMGMGGVPLQGQVLGGQPGLVGAPLLQKGVMPVGGMVGTGMAGVQHETVVMPAVVQETIRTDRIVEVQPVIHREIDQTTVHHIEKHVTEAPAPNRGGVVQMAPIVQETIRPQIIDEITPVIHRQVATTQVERVEEHIGERVVAPTQHTNQVVYENRGVVPGGVIGIVPGYQTGSFGYPRLGRDQKALQYEQKAQRYQQAGNMAKAQKNLQKAQRHRQYSQPGFQRPVVSPQQRNDKLARLQQKAALYDQRGNPQKANLARQRAARLQAKYGMQAGRPL